MNLIALTALISILLITPGNYETPLPTKADTPAVTYPQRVVTPNYTVEKTAENKYMLDLGTEIMGEPKDYAPLQEFLLGLSSDATVVLNLHNDGGRVDAGVIILNGLVQTKAHTIADVNGYTYSMGAMIACAAKEVNLHPYSFLMFHSGSGGFRGKISDAISGLNAHEKNMKRMLSLCTKHNILTEEQILATMNGHDLYVFKEDIKSPTKSFIENMFKGIYK